MRNNKYLGLFLALLTANCAWAATIPSNTIRFGDGAASNKQIIFNKGLGSTNPRFQWNNSSSSLQFANDGTTFNDIGTGTVQDASDDQLNTTCSTAVGSNALTISLKDKSGSNCSAGSPCKMSFRSSTATSGVYNQRSVTGALSVTLSSGSTLGFTSAVAHDGYVYALDNAGTVELAVAGSRIIDEGSLQTTTSEGGAGAADSALVLYSTTSRSNVPVRLLCRFVATEATAGTWATAPSEVSPWPFAKKVPRSEVTYSGFTGHGAVDTKIVRLTTQSVSRGSAITGTSTANNGTILTINEDGVYSTYGTLGSPNQSVVYVGLSRDAAGSLTNQVYNLTFPTLLSYGASRTDTGLEAVSVALSWSGFLPAGSTLRMHTDGSSNPVDTDICIFGAVKVSD